MPEIKIQIESAHPQDQGLGKARLEPEVMASLDVRPGDLVEIIGEKTTYAKVWRALPQDWGQKKNPD